MHRSKVCEESRRNGAEQQVNGPVPLRARPWAWLTIAATLLLFSNGAYSVPLAAWLAPVFLLRFVRTQSLKVGLPSAYVLLATAFAFQFRGMVPIPGVGYYIFLVLWSIPLVLPYVVDRLLVCRLTGFTASFVFPTTWAATEYLVSRGPYGSWGSAAYSQYGNLPLLQLLSLTGLWGITFLIGWFAAVCNWLWEEGLDARSARRGAGLCLGTIAIVMLLGGARLALFPPSSQTVRVASISREDVAPAPSGPTIHRLFEAQATRADLDVFHTWTETTNEDLLSRAEREMRAGARIVFWGEGNAFLLKEEEAGLVARGENLAARYKGYLGMAMVVVSNGQTPCCQNKLTLIQPDGRVAWEYIKARPVPGAESAHMVRGDGKLRELETPYGRLSSIICFDGDFPQLLAQAGTSSTDVMLDPSNDWHAIDPWHTQMASFRAIEQGFNLIRQTSQGLSATFDYQGRRLASVDDYHTTDHTMISEVPTKGVRTIYSRLGDWFAWVCLAGLVLLTVRDLHSGVEPRTGQSPTA
jgi:apolipoprotein N-acyltransferase